MSLLKTGGAPYALASGLVFLSLSPIQANAADVLQEISAEERVIQRAVSDVNAKIESAYLHYDLDDDDGKAYLLQGAVSLPVGQQFGFQFDVGTLNGEFESSDLLATGFGGHLFWRDPAIGLLGLYGHHVDYDGGIQTTRLGVELEWYGDAVSLEVFAGNDHLETPIGDEDYFAGDASLAWYATDNFRLSAGIQHSFEQTRGLVGMEAMADMGGFSPAFFANAAFGEDETTLMAGIRLYLGQSKSLKARHREDDPAIGLFDHFGALANCPNDGESTGGFVTDFSARAPSSNASARLAPPTISPSSYELDGCDIETN